jgi:N6-adenosine-specific RNA methylase IME4
MTELTPLNATHPETPTSLTLPTPKPKRQIHEVRRFDPADFESAPRKKRRVIPAKTKRSQCLQALVRQRQRFDVLLADPPWQYQAMGKGLWNIGTPYPTLTLEEMKQLPVAAVAAEHSVLFMWTTATKYEEALALMRAWGFEFKAIFKMWTKVDAEDQPRMGVGMYVRNCLEMLLLGTRGRAMEFVIDPECRKTMTNDLRAEAVRVHSRKPIEQYACINAYCRPGVKKMELFARSVPVGWVGWGLDLQGFVQDRRVVVEEEEEKMTIAPPPVVPATVTCADTFVKWLTMNTRVE